MHRRSGHLLQAARQTTGRPLIARPDAGTVPAWAGRWASRPDNARLITIRVPTLSDSDGPTLERATAGAYADLLRQLGRANWHPVRIWNFVPNIQADCGEGLNRYMWFNSGRHRAFREYFGSNELFDRVLPTASAVGVEGDELIIHALACRQAGMPVQNPRQHAPHHYSKRFGPLPPCFARGTLTMRADGRAALLVGGTASVLGEDSVHVGDLRSQLEETIENLCAVVRAAFNVNRRDACNCYRELRVYHVRGTDEAQIRSSLPSSFPGASRIEFVVADLCRPELLVEIEGLALRPDDDPRSRP